jgi:hypothetical protein
MSGAPSTKLQLPEAIVWLADAPLFIDAEQVYRFYDAVARPETAEGTTTLEITSQNADQISGKLGIEAGVSPGKLAALLTPVFAFIKPEVKASGEAQAQHEETDQNSRKIELHPISTPQRQLVQLTLHYLIHHSNRLFFVDNPSDEYWRQPETISQVPRELVFLSLPSQEEAKRLNLPETKIIPTAAEFTNGKIMTFFDKLEKDGEKPPVYPEKEESLEKLYQARKEYWQWFDKNFSATRAMQVVEEVSSENGQIRWIDFRVPITQEGHTLHLHASPSGTYATGVFAYNFIKRGYKHGLRLVGTIKSEPAMNILGIYDK